MGHTRRGTYPMLGTAMSITRIREMTGDLATDSERLERPYPVSGVIRTRYLARTEQAH